MTTTMAVWAVKRTALSIMITPTGTRVFRAARLTIHPLGEWQTGREGEKEKVKGKTRMRDGGCQSWRNVVDTWHQGFMFMCLVPHNCFSSVPETPTGNSNGHDDIDDNLHKEYEKKGKKVEGAVSPVKKIQDFWWKWNATGVKYPQTI